MSEVERLQRLLWAVVMAAGGTVKVRDSVLEQADRTHAVLQRYTFEDDTGHGILFSAFMQREE